MLDAAARLVRVRSRNLQSAGTTISVNGEAIASPPIMVVAIGSNSAPPEIAIGKSPKDRKSVV